MLVTDRNLRAEFEFERHHGEWGCITHVLSSFCLPLFTPPLPFRETHRFPNRYKLVLVTDRSLRAEFEFERRHGEWGYIIHVNPVNRIKEVVVPVEYTYFNGIKNVKIMKLLMTPMQVCLCSVQSIAGRPGPDP